MWRRRTRGRNIGENHGRYGENRFVRRLRPPDCVVRIRQERTLATRSTHVSHHDAVCQIDDLCRVEEPWFIAGVKVHVVHVSKCTRHGSQRVSLTTHLHPHRRLIRLLSPMESKLSQHPASDESRALYRVPQCENVVRIVRVERDLKRSHSWRVLYSGGGLGRCLLLGRRVVFKVGAVVVVVVDRLVVDRLVVVEFAVVHVVKVARGCPWSCETPKVEVRIRMCCGVWRHVSAYVQLKIGGRVARKHDECTLIVLNHVRRPPPWYLR